MISGTNQGMGTLKGRQPNLGILIMPIGFCTVATYSYHEFCDSCHIKLLLLLLLLNWLNAVC